MSLRSRRFRKTGLRGHGISQRLKQGLDDVLQVREGRDSSPWYQAVNTGEISSSKRRITMRTFPGVRTSDHRTITPRSSKPRDLYTARPELGLDGMVFVTAN